jgi:hypothetical protein
VNDPAAGCPQSCAAEVTTKGHFISLPEPKQMRRSAVGTACSQEVVAQPLRLSHLISLLKRFIAPSLKHPELPWLVVR